MQPKLIFSDFDGTLTLNGQLSPEFFHVLDLVKTQDIPFVIISGRSLSWGHFLLSHTPIDYAIMEGGGVLNYRTRDSFAHKCFVDDEELHFLEEQTFELINKFPDLPFSEDTFGRLTDRAVDLKFLQENPRIHNDLENDLEHRGLSFSTSNVHLNFWSGEISKGNAAQLFLKEYYPHISIDECLFFGDAPNDQSMFKVFNHSVGVSNIREFARVLKHPPRIILEGEEKSEINGVLSYLLDLWKK